MLEQQQQQTQERKLKLVILDPSDDQTSLPIGEWTRDYFLRSVASASSSSSSASSSSSSSSSLPSPSSSVGLSSLPSVEDIELEIFRVAFGEWPSEEVLAVADGLVVGGSYRSVLEEDQFPWISQLITILQTHLVQSHQSKKPFLGICYGGQILARVVFGRGAVTTMKLAGSEPEFGYKTLTLKQEGEGAGELSLFQDFPATFAGISMHFDAFQHPELIPVVTSDQWGNHAFRAPSHLVNGNQNVWGLQFHPEMTEGIAEGLFGRVMESKAAPVIHQHPTADWSLSSRIALNFLRIVSYVKSISSSQVLSPLFSQPERKEHRSVHTAGIGEVHLMPMSVITRPLESNLDEEKVRSLMETLMKEEEEGIAGTSQSKVPAIDVLWVEKPSSSDKRNYYFSFGGCHRYEAHKRLGRTNILAKLVKTDESAVRAHLGLSLSLLDH